MIHRFLVCIFLFTLAAAMVASAQPPESNVDSNYDHTGGSWDWSSGSEEGG
jgi:hypothetical protein